MQTTHCQRAPCAAPCRSLTTIRAPLALAQMASRAVSFTLRIQCRQCSSRLTDSCMADLLGASIPERGAASTLQELLLRSQPLPRSPLRQYSSSSRSEAAAMAAALCSRRSRAARTAFTAAGIRLCVNGRSPAASTATTGYGAASRQAERPRQQAGGRCRAENAMSSVGQTKT